MITPLPGITATKPGSATTPFPGVEAQVVDERDGEPIGEGQGLLVLERPWPSMLRGLYKEDDRFVETYFSRFGVERYLVGDAARRDEDGYFWVIGRIDDVVNVSGHRLSTAEVESAIVAHPDVAEAAVIGQADEDTGQAICAFVTLRGDIEPSDELSRRASAPTVAERIGKFARPKRIVWADDLPKTRSGKIMRRLLRDIAEGRALGDVTTLRDPDVMEELEAKIAEEQAEGRLTLCPGDCVLRFAIRSTAISSACSCSWTLFSSRRASASALSSSSSSSSSISAISGARKRCAKEPVSRATKPMPTSRTTMETISPPVVRRLDVGAERGHRRDRPVDVVPEVEVLAAARRRRRGRRRRPRSAPPAAPRSARPPARRPRARAGRGAAAAAGAAGAGPAGSAGRRAGPAG